MYPFDATACGNHPKDYASSLSATFDAYNPLVSASVPTFRAELESERESVASVVAGHPRDHFSSEEAGVTLVRASPDVCWYSDDVPAAGGDAGTFDEVALILAGANHPARADDAALAAAAA
jgi:hypothetical protein